MKRHLSLRHKLTLLLVGTVSLVLLAVTVVSLFVDLRAIRERITQRYVTLASVVAVQSAAALSIADIDPSSVQEVVSNLAVERPVVLAVLYNRQGTAVAHYQSKKHPGEVRPPLPKELGPRLTDDGFLDVLQEVTLRDGQVIGHLYLRMSLDVLQTEAQRQLQISSGVFVAGVLLAGLLSIVFQRIIANPILNLAELTQRVSREGDYSLRAIKLSQDELGVLCDGFNGMLEQIQRRDAELHHHRQTLEETVERRTAQLQARTEELSRSNTELEQFAYIASHDLQEPLRKVQAFGDMLATQFQPALGTEGQDYLQRMQSAAQRMQVLINDLLKFSRVMTKAQPLVAVNLKLVAEQVLVDLEIRIQQTGGRVELGDLPIVQADELQMRELLQNLIGNSLKYHRPGVAPVVSVQAKLVNSNHGVPGTPLSQPICEITVTDNGIGFEEKYAERIFAPFERLHGREYEGTGMGLAICRKIVERHGGNITAHGIMNQGAVFVVKLPVNHSEGSAQ